MKINKESISVPTVAISLVLGLVSGMATSLVVFQIYQSPQLQMYQKQLGIMNDSLSYQSEQIRIMNESLMKRVQLDLQVVPRYDWKVFTSGNGSVRLENTTLTISRTENTVFHVYVSNVGNSIAHLLYWTVAIWMPHQTLSGPVYEIQNVVLAPYDLYNMTYILTPSMIGNDNEMVLTFVVMSTESIVYQTVNATFQQ
jgi:hypothetical protein